MNLCGPKKEFLKQCKNSFANESVDYFKVESGDQLNSFYAILRYGKPEYRHHIFISPGQIIVSDINTDISFKRLSGKSWADTLRQLSDFHYAFNKSYNGGGFCQDCIDQMMVDNPGKLYSESINRESINCPSLEFIRSWCLIQRVSELYI